MKSLSTRGRSLAAVSALTAAILLSPSAEAVSIVATPSVSSPVNVNDQFDVAFSVTGWNASDPEVDLVSFRVTWDPTVFAFVSDTIVSDGTEFLAETNQGPGYSLADNSNSSFANLGVYLLNISDVGDGTRGSIGGVDGAGTLGSIRLRALAVGSSTIQTSAPGGDPDSTFGDNNLNGIA